MDPSARRLIEGVLAKRGLLVDKPEGAVEADPEQTTSEVAQFGQDALQAAQQQDTAPLHDIASLFAVPESP